MHVVITGANRGIGLALTEKFIREGHDVTALCRRSSSELKETSAEIREGVDVTNSTALESVANELREIDILVNNSGVLYGDTFDSINFEQIQKQFEVNTLGALRVMLTLGRKVKTGGKIGIITSRMGSIADNTSGGQYGYRISKAAANAVGKSLAEDLRPRNIPVFLLHPGYVRTEMTSGRGLIDTLESSEGFYNILISKTMEQTGTFWHTNGEELPW